MVKEDDYDFEDEPEDDELEDPEDQEPPEDYEEDYSNSTKRPFQDIIKSRNKLFQEKKIKYPEYRERIGRLNLYLFGDPQNQSYIGKLQEFEDEINHPHTMGHPIVNRAKEVVSHIRLLQIEYIALNRFMDNSLNKVGTLLDNTIKDYDKTVKTYEKKLSKIKEGDVIEEKGEDALITYELIWQFMENYGFELFKRHEEARSKNENRAAIGFMGQFVYYGKYFFNDYHVDSKELANRIFKAYYTGKNSSLLPIPPKTLLEKYIPRRDKISAKDLPIKEIDKAEQGEYYAKKRPEKEDNKASVSKKEDLNKDKDIDDEEIQELMKKYGGESNE